MLLTAVSLYARSAPTRRPRPRTPRRAPRSPVAPDKTVDRPRRLRTVTAPGDNAFDAPASPDALTELRELTQTSGNLSANAASPRRTSCLPTPALQHSLGGRTAPRGHRGWGVVSATPSRRHSPQSQMAAPDRQPNNVRSATRPHIDGRRPAGPKESASISALWASPSERRWEQPAVAARLAPCVD
jgi:hypothetical protein